MSSDINDGGFSQQLEAIRQRLTLLRDALRDIPEEDLAAQPSFSSGLQRHVLDELQTALALLQAAQLTIRSRFSLAETMEIERLQTSLQEKEILLREIHHRVKNNLQIFSSLLDLQVMRSGDPVVQELLRNNQSRINSIALVHERLSHAEDRSEINLGDYIQGLAVTLVRINAIDPNQITLRIHISSSIQVSPDRAIPIGLILNELVSNALKHGLRDRAGEIIVALAQDGSGQAMLRVSDSGNQMPIDFDPNAAESLGFQLIRSLVQQINGTLDIERGTQTTVRVGFS
ncbi:sensor histidine kinase [Myxacorys almedinensis]|uniref:histidine kinase n=1 Tax=Myxacorys almedinensis A TaxID=2690445 RepID=A0A8J7Z052_9CYAN|nr:sensor histidine kinase [Myxacorys almedinensis]NDJ17274.1 hypothetical protein [Myxacorys almedinensis A]